LFHIVLHRPEIPPNAGNIIRLSANTGCTLHLIKPMGFHLDHPAARRAGLDYDEIARVKVHESLAACLDETGGARVFAIETGGAKSFSDVAFQAGDVLLFGSETTGLPPDVLEAIPRERQLSIPMQPGNRSLNLSNSVAVVVYEAWRQNGYDGATVSSSRP